MSRPGDAARRAELVARWREIDRLLADLAAGRVDPAANPDPAVREGELLGELDGIEFELGEIARRHLDGYWPDDDHDDGIDG